ARARPSESTDAGRRGMTQGHKGALRPVTADERATLGAIARSGSERADRVAHAAVVLAVADGATFSAAARQVGRRSPRAVATLVTRFNQEGVAAVAPRHGGGPPRVYGPEPDARILRQGRRPPHRGAASTATA